jgi:hypothetical protein
MAASVRPVACDCGLQAALDLLCGDIGIERHLVHVDQVLSQRFEVDFGPICLRVGFEHPDDLLDGAEGVLAGQSRRGIRLLLTEVEIVVEC